jgi:hypothetical protein
MRNRRKSTWSCKSRIETITHNGERIDKTALSLEEKINFERGKMLVDEGKVVFDVCFGYT